VGNQVLFSLRDFCATFLKRTPFFRKRWRGWPVATIKGGRVMARDGRIVGKPSGRYLPRFPARAAGKSGARQEEVARA